MEYIYKNYKILVMFNLFRRSQPANRGLAAPSDELLRLFSAVPVASGVPVVPSTALRSTTFLAGVRAISETVGSMPAHLYQRDGTSRHRVTDGPVASLLNGDWNPWTGNVEARTAMQMDAILHGYGIAQVVRVVGQPREIHRLDPTTVAIEADAGTNEPVFKVRDGHGTEHTLSFHDVLFVPTPGWTFSRPLCLLDCCKEAVGIDLAMAERQARFLGAAVSTSGKLTVPSGVGPEKASELIKAFLAAHGGARKAGGILALNGGLEFEESPAFNFADAQFLELRRHTTQEIARAMKVPPVLVGDLERATFTNVTELNRQFLTMTLLPWLEVWQSALERTLLTPSQRADHFIEFQTADLLRADIAARFAAYRQATGGAWLTPNEVRSYENKPPVDGGDELILQAGQGSAQ